MYVRVLSYRMLAVVSVWVLCELRVICIPTELSSSTVSLQLLLLLLLLLLPHYYTTTSITAILNDNNKNNTYMHFHFLKPLTFFVCFILLLLFAYKSGIQFLLKDPNSILFMISLGLIFVCLILVVLFTLTFVAFK